MSSRTVSVVLSAQVQNYLTNMKAAEQRTLEVERATRTATAQFRAHNDAVQKLGVGMVAVGATAAAGLALAIKASTEFGAKMAQLQSLSHATAGQMKQAADAAMSVGTAYGFTASQVADAQIELQKAGIGIQAQLGGALKGALTLAAAGQMDVAQATEITTVAMTQFGLKASQVPHIADLLSAGADKALGSVGDLGEALKNGGLQAANMGLSIDQTVGLLSAFANAGILGAEAGTQMRSMFLRLENPTATAQKVLDKYGISINDASGKFVGMTKFAGELRDQLGQLDPATRNAALATVFGSHAIVGATAIYNLGSKGVQGWNDRVNETGFAAAQAAGKMNSLQGDTQKLAAAFQTELIKAGSGANDALRALTQDATGLLTAFGQIPAPLQDVAVTATVLTAGVGLLGGGFLVAVPKIVAFKAAMADLGLSVKGAVGSFGALGGMVAGMALLMSMQQKAGEAAVVNTQQVTAASKAMQDHLNHVDDLFKGNALVGAGIRNAFEEELSGEAANNKGLDVLGTHIGDVYRSHEAALSALGSQLSGVAKINYGQATASFEKLVGLVGAAGDKGKQLKLVTMLGPDFQSSLSGIAKGIGVAATSTNLLAIATGKGVIGQEAASYAYTRAQVAASKQADTLASLAGQATSATTNIDELQKTIEGFGSAQLDARSATRAMYQAIDAATAAVAKNGATLDVHTQKGRDNQAALDGIATAADQAASKILKQTGDTGKAAAAMKTGRDAYIRAAEAMGLSAGQAKHLADQMELIPSNIAVAVHVNDVDLAKQRLADLQTKLDALHGKSVTVHLAAELDMTNSQIKIASMAASGVDYFGNPVRRAAGGAIDGPGPKGVDSVPAMLAPGEHVLTTRDVAALGGQGGVYAFRASLAAGEVPGYAAGGAVGDAHRDIDKYRRQVADARRSLTHASKRQHDAAQARLTAAEDRLNTAQTRLDSLAHSREDFVSGERRGPVDPLSYVDQLRSMSRDTADFGPYRRASFDKAANGYESAIVKLTAASAKATEQLDALKQSSAQLHDSIAQAVTGGFQASAVPLTGAHDASTRTVASGWVTRNGIRMRNYRTVDTAASAGHLTAGGIAAYYTHGGHDATQFAENLKRLAQRGLNPHLLAEIAGYGVAQGAPIAAALLSGSAAQLAQVNAGYGSIASAGNLAGTTVANDTYAKQIAAAEANAAKITAQIKSDGEKLRALIARAFGLHGYATGTASAEAGIRWVGEDGPELVGFRGGEAVLNRADSARWVRGAAGGGGSAGGPPVEVHVAPFPDTITVQDASGFTATMRVVAHQVVSQRNDQIAVRVMGAA